MNNLNSFPSERALPTALRPIRAEVTPPGSKSITNRALLAAALAEGDSRLSGALFSDDTRFMSSALRQAGVGIEASEDKCEFFVSGTAGLVGPVQERIFVGNAGTAMRFLTSYFTLGQGSYILDGVPRMRERPIQDLLESLQALGANARSEFENGCPPVVIEAKGLPGGSTAMPGHRSSQYFSSILLTAPYTQHGVDLDVIGPLTSQPYLDLTGDVMSAFGVGLRNHGYRTFHVEPAHYVGHEFVIEPDASAASYLLGAAAVTQGTVMIRNLRMQSRQGDIEFARLLEKMGCTLEDTNQGLRLIGSEHLTGIDVDLNACSDIALTLAAVAPFASTPTTIRNVEHIRIQETDRIQAITTELRRAGVTVEEWQDGFRVFPASPHAAVFETYDDHRIAMSLALIGLRTPGCSVLHPEAVNKTFPDFFDVLESMM